MYPVRITGSMVLLRELTEMDTVALHKVYGNEEATRHLSFEPRTMEQVAGIINAAIRSATADPRTEYMLAVADKDEELVGAARLATGEYESATIGFALRPDQWARARDWKQSASFSALASPNSACTGSAARAARSTRHQRGPCGRPE
jgi:[ribosomal protein S5]-alanine N-acetyltransferase